MPRVSSRGIRAEVWGAERALLEAVRLLTCAFGIGWGYVSRRISSPSKRSLLRTQVLVRLAAEAVNFSRMSIFRAATNAAIGPRSSPGVKPRSGGVKGKQDGRSDGHAGSGVKSRRPSQSCAWRGLGLDGD